MCNFPILYRNPCRKSHELQGLLQALKHPKSQNFGLGLTENWTVPKNTDSEREFLFHLTEDLLEEGWASRKHLPIVDAPMRHQESSRLWPAALVGVRNAMTVTTTPGPLATSFIHSFILQTVLSLCAWHRSWCCGHSWEQSRKPPPGPHGADMPACTCLPGIIPEYGGQEGIKQKRGKEILKK